MKVSSILVISVIIKLQDRIIFRHIFSLNMKVSSTLVISVIINLQNRQIFRDIFGLAMLKIQSRIYNKSNMHILDFQF